MKEVVIHYDEIALKGGNREYFEGLLVKNIRSNLGKNLIKLYKRYGRIICEVKSEKVSEVLSKTPGIANFSFVEKAKLDLSDIKKTCLRVLEGKKFESFKVVSKRANKNFKLNSMELNKEIGSFIINKFGSKVKMKFADLKLFIEVGEKEAFVYIKKIEGIGGLPVGSSGKFLSSLSGGIDSPVASYMMMKRGCRVVFVHIYNSTTSNVSVLEKLKSIVKELNKFQLHSKLYIVPFDKIQKEIIMKVPAKFRMIVYRRFMMKIINHISWKEKVKGVVTGDSIGQVASQTIENLSCIYDASKLVIANPLIGMNKREIIDIAKKIGTYEKSIIPYPDCCSYMIAKNPETKGNLNKILELEKEISDDLVKISVSKAKVLKI